MKQIQFQSIFDTPSVKQGTLNDMAQTPDGRVWHYLYATEAITKHMVTSRPVVTGVDTVSSAASDLDSTKYVYITEGSAGWTVGAYQDHWVIVDSGTGVGQLGKIKDNTADTLELYFPHAFTTALAVSDSDITILHQPDAEKIAVTNQYTEPNGIAQVTFASGDYGWFLVRGIGGVIMGTGAGTINYNACPGDDTEGYAVNMDAGDTLEEMAPLGRLVAVSDTADKACLIDVKIF